jgi:anti-anti-sigma factor
MSESPVSGTPVTSVEHQPRAVVVRVLTHELVAKGDLDSICRAIDTARASEPLLPFILDMGSVAFMGSLAMGTLVGLHKEFQTRGQRLIFVGLQTNVHRSFSVSHLDRMIEIMPDVATAMQSVGGDA